MHPSVHELENIIDKYYPLLQSIPRDEMELKSSPSKWSKKEIVGHLIDSAQNNIRRFITAQYEETPTIVYAQEKWVLISNYQGWDKVDLINLWSLLNTQIAEILKNTATEKWQRNCQTETTHTIEWLASDYNRHLLHHLHAILELEPINYR